jgi:NhaC family Na+:H+ antiporter
VANSGNRFLDDLLSKGGMSSMLNTVWLIICALAFGGVLERTGILDHLLRKILQRVHSAAGLVSATVGTCIATNVLAADQFISVALPGRMFRDEYARRGLSRLNLSRTLEDSATLTSTLGVATLSYAPFAFFNLLCPLLAVVYAFFHFAQKPLEPGVALSPGQAV